MGYLRNALQRVAPVVVATFGFVLTLGTARVEAQEFGHHLFGNALEALVITIDGPFEHGSADRFRQWLETEQPEGFRVRLNSPGGVLAEGMRIGSIIREYEFWTEVGAVVHPEGENFPKETPGYCASACALAFLGGVHRSPEAVDKLGFHQFFGGVNSESLARLSAEEIYSSTLSESQKLSGRVISYMVSMGIDARVFVEASVKGPNDMRTFSEAQAIEYDVVTPHGFSAFRLLPEGDGLLARSSRLSPTHAYDSATSLGFFCQSERPGEAWIMIETDMSGARHEEIRKSIFDVTIRAETRGGSRLELPIPQEHILSDGTGPGDTLRWFLKIGKQEIEAILTAEELSTVIFVPRAAGGYGTSNRLSDLDGRMIRSAFLHCI